MKKLCVTILIFMLILSSVGIVNAAEVTYTVKKGDTLSEIGKAYGVPYMTIAEMNNIKNPSLIFIGQNLIIQGFTHLKLLRVLLNALNPDFRINLVDICH